VLLVLSVLLVTGSMDNWAVVRYFGGRGLAANPAELARSGLQPTTRLLSVSVAVLFGSVAPGAHDNGGAALVYWLTARGWQLRARFSDLNQLQNFDLRDLGLEGAFQSALFACLAACFWRRSPCGFV